LQADAGVFTRENSRGIVFHSLHIDHDDSEDRFVRLPEIYAHRRPAISVEFFPPKTPAGEALLAQRLERFRALDPAFCSITYGAGGSTREKTLEWARRLRNEYGFETMCHLTCVGHSREELRSLLEGLWADAIENIIALRGDPPRGQENWQPHPEGLRHAVELVRLARSVAPFGIAVAGFPEGHPESPTEQEDLRYLKEKVDAGADVVITQLFFDNTDFFHYVNAARAVGVSVPIVPGIMPFRTVAQLEKFTTVYARTRNGPARIPEKLRKRLQGIASDEDAARLGIAYAIEQCEELLDRGVPGIHFYCLNESDAVDAILQSLRSSHRLA
jgi:methylenetetrahydrofolate reductase (NADPH)